jgi:two-component system, OmpR family, alkaline phosphatase synthesis response regulator PhoP
MAKILVVDDDQPTRVLVKATLEGKGHVVIESSNGAECLLATNTASPNLILMDVNMPVMDGFQTLHALKSNPLTQQIPVIMLTARAAETDMVQGWQEGVDFYLTKPFTVEELLAVVDRVLASLEEEAGA